MDERKKPIAAAKQKWFFFCAKKEISEFEKVALENDKVQASIGDKTVVKVIAIPKKLINIVVK